MKFNQNYKTIFLDQKSPITTISQKVNIIISPSLYWVKKLSIALKYTRDVKKLLPSIFEDILPDGNYSYHIYKKGGEFFAFAYEDKLILEALLQKGIEASNIANIYFAQSEFDNMQDAVKINNEEALYLKDDLVVLVPLRWVDKYSDFDSLEFSHSKNKIALKHYAHIVDNSSLYKMGGVLVAILILVAAQYLIVAKKKADILDAKDKLFVKYGLKPTLMQNQSLLKKYRTLHVQQNLLREGISHILAIKLQSTLKLSYLWVKNSTIEADFKGASKSDEAYIKKELLKKGVKFKTSLDEKTLHVEITL